MDCQKLGCRIINFGLNDEIYLTNPKCCIYLWNDKKLINLKTIFMKKNVGNVDQVIRIIAGVAIGVVGIIYQSWWGLVGIVPILTAMLNFCPLYPIFGIKTNKDED